MQAFDNEGEVPVEKQGRARGGIVRAQRLSPQERRRIAQAAARARWSDDIGQVIAGAEDKPLKIGDIEIECYVLEDDTRVLTQASFLQSLGRHRKANVRRYPGEGSGEERIPPILQGKALAPFISREVLEKSRPITFAHPKGGRASGYNAELLPAVCDVYLAARAAGKLPQNQQHVADRALLLVRGLARVGIIALVDEATGYQEVRARRSLVQILEAFIAKELQPWVKTFPDEFYRELFRLRGLDYPGGTVRRPQYFGKLTNDIIYRRLAPGVLAELQNVTPRDDNGRRRHRYHQHLTGNIGYPKLREHLGSVVTLMKLSVDWRDFNLKLDQIHPRVGDTITMILPPEAPDNGRGL